MYKATNIDTDKALQAIEEFRRNKSREHQRELYGIQKYYEGLEKGLDLAERLFECSNYEKDEPEPTHIKIQYKNREYTIFGNIIDNVFYIKIYYSTKKKRGINNA